MPWFLTTDRAELKWFTRPPDNYAILSHVWQKGSGPPEQSFQEVQQINFECARTGQNPRELVSAKIRACCVFAGTHGFKLVWIDTCCINQMSSAELSEAINSMFVWYAKATICYAFLDDVCDCETPASPGSSFRRSEWFKRGWTLQELIAPKDVIFLTHAWTPIASKLSIAPTLHEITGIDIEVLLCKTSLEKVSVARRMSWAAGRETTREEDEAYCLMGIFGVYLPTIYGEGREAFIRLQEEIMRRIPDATMFVWGPRGDVVDTTRGYRSVFPTSSGISYIDESCLLATRPSCFTGTSCNFARVPSREFAAVYGISQHSAHFTVSSHGIQAICPIIAFSSGCILLLLPCRETVEDVEMFAALLLRIQSESPPYGIGTRLPFEEPTIPEKTALSFQLTDQVRYRQSHQPVRFVLIPSGFDFTTCLQRPLRETEPSLRRKWKRVYVAYRRQHILCIASPSDISSTSPLFDLRRDASMSGPPYRLYFPKWVVSRLENGGFAVPPEFLEPLLVLNTGARHTLSLSNPSTEEELHIELRTDAPSLPSMSSRSRHRDLGQLWCTATVHDRSVEAVETQVRRWKPTYYDGALTDNNNTVSALTLSDSVEEQADNAGVAQDGFVELWEHEGGCGRKEVYLGRWRLLLAFTRLGECPRRDDPVSSHVYLFDIDLVLA
ncbi:HET-domain-containing protein [Cubamyces menziesii]|nr:HET-domain-containing protein [Cubamyces menziesii]